jgi:deoxyribose-phosphate aldolase
MTELTADRFDHAALAPGATREETVREARRATAARVRGLCVLPYRVATVRPVLEYGVRCIAVVGFPAAGSRADTLADEARRAMADGADELDLVLPLGRLRDHAFGALAADVAAIRTAAGDPPTKLIVEVSELDDGLLEEVVRRILVPVGAAFLKTGTGVYGRSIGPDRIASIRALLPAGVGLKVSGGIRGAADARAALGAGADVLGASRTFAILDEIRIAGLREQDGPIQG